VDKPASGLRLGGMGFGKGRAALGTALKIGRLRVWHSRQASDEGATNADSLQRRQ